MICSDIWHKYDEWYFEIVIRETTLKYHEWYLCQISRTNHAIIIYTTTRKSFVIFTRRYFKLNWNTIAVSQNRPFPSSPGPLFQNRGSGELGNGLFWPTAMVFQFNLISNMEIIFDSHANKTHFHKKGCAPSLILKVRVFGTRKWPIAEISHVVV